MKKIIFLVITLLTATTIFANPPDNDQISEQHWKKKTVLGIEPVNVNNKEITVPFKQCDTFGKNCVQTGVFSHTLSDDDISILSWQIYEWMINNRYNTLLSGNGNTTILNEESEKGFKTPGMPIFNLEESTGFKESVERYSFEIQKLYDQFKYSDTKNSDTDLPDEIISSLVDLEFIFVVDIKDIKASGKAVPHDIEHPHVDGAGTGFLTFFDIAIKADIHIYRYNPEQNMFVRYKKIHVRTTDRILNKTGLKDDKINTVFLIEPPDLNSETIKKLWRESLISEAKNLGLATNYKLKNNRNFSDLSPIMKVNRSNIEAKSGIKEDLRIDQPVVILKQENGKTYKTGYAKARKIGKNCSNDSNTTRFRRLYGNIDENDMLHTLPWSGMMISFGGGVNQYRIAFIENNENGQEEGLKLGGITLGNQLGMSLDLGYLTNLRFLSETWFSFGGNFYTGFKPTVGYYKPPYLGGGYFGLSHRIHLTKGGMFFAPFAKLGFIAGTAEVSKYNPNDGHLFFGSIAFEPSVQIGFTFNQMVEMIFQGGYHLPFYGSMYKHDDKLADRKVTFKHGFTASLNFQIHIPAFSGSSACMSKPSKYCRKIEISGQDYDPIRRKRPAIEKEIKKEKVEKEAPKPAKPDKPEIKDISKLIPVKFDKNDVGIIDLLNIDTGIITAYDKAVNIEKQENIENRPIEAVEAWKELAEMKGENPFREIAGKRVLMWLKYLFAWDEIMKDKEIAKTKLLKIITLSSITDEQKLHAVVQYFNKYGAKHGISDILKSMSDIKDQEMILKILNDPAFDKSLKNVLRIRCENGFGKECFTYGKTFPEDSKKQSEFINKSCELNHKEACDMIQNDTKTQDGEQKSLETMMEKYDY
jgi:hypothetical protein